MRSLFYIVSALSVMALAVWAYQENYRTQASLKAVEDMHVQIAAERERLAMLRAEWAYLNRPERLRDLADMNFDSLQLMPLTPERFGKIDDLAHPTDFDLVLDASVPVQGEPAQ